MITNNGFNEQLTPEKKDITPQNELAITDKKCPQNRSFFAATYRQLIFIPSCS
jgi:hypothetical protein